MILNIVDLINTELGKFPVYIKTINNNGNILYSGKVIDSHMDIHCVTPTKESCLKGLINGVEIYLNNWLYNQMVDLKEN